MKTLRDDKGGEYMSNVILEFTNECGIECQHTVRALPQQNDVCKKWKQGRDRVAQNTGSGEPGREYYE
jgi:hypothetical protein